MKRRFIIILICISTFFAFNTSKSAFGQYFDNSQTAGFFGNFSINANIGTALPFADVSQDFKPYQDDWQMAYGAIFRKQFSPIFGIGGQFLMGNLHGTVLTWGDGSTADQYFDSEFMEMNIHAVINLSNLIFGYNENRTVHLYSTIGLGVANWASIRRDINNDAEISRSGFDVNNAKAWTPSLSIPVGLGMYFAVGKKFGFNIEGSMHRLNSDDLDAYVSGKSNQDLYSYLSVGVTYNLSSVGNVFRKAGKQETNYDREARKLEKYQERLAKKNKRDEVRDEMEQERKTNIEKSKRSRRDPSAGMPKVIEYDATYNHESIRNINKQFNNKVVNPPVEEMFKGEKELVFDEGKHFITGVGKKKTIPTTSANIISARDALKLKTNSYESLTVTDGRGRTTTSIISGGILTIPETGKIYTVQIMASRVPANNISDYREKYGIHQPIYYTLQNGLYRYSTGLFTNYYDAQTYANIIKRNGLGDAFVATYNNGQRVLN